jgi:hypothetical protein
VPGLSLGTQSGAAAFPRMVEQNIYYFNAGTPWTEADILGLEIQR